MWVLIFGTYTAGLVADNDREGDARRDAVCVAVDVVQIALGDLYDYAEELQGPTPEIAGARARLEKLTEVGDC